MATSTIGQITTEQFLAMPDQYDASGNQIKQELIAGEIVCMAHPSKRHDVIKNTICKILDRFLDSRGDLGFIAYVEIAYAVSDQDSLAPDVSVVRKIRVIEGEDRIISGAPEVAVEVVSPTDTATHIKAKVAAYLSGGSQTVWVVYPQMKVVDVHSAAVLHEVKGEQPIEDELLPGF